MFAPKSEGGNFEKHPMGWTTGVCSRVIDLGTHWNEGKKKYQRKIMIAFESSKLMETGDFAGEPFLLFGNFNYSMYQNAHLCQFIEDWRGKRFVSQDQADKFDMSKLVGQPAFMNVVHSECGKYTNIQTIGPVPDGMVAPEIKGKTILIDQSNLDMKEVEKLSDKMRERVMSAEERKVLNQGSGAGNAANGIVSGSEQIQARTQYDDRNPPPTTNSPMGGDFDDDIPFISYGFRTVI